MLDTFKKQILLTIIISLLIYYLWKFGILYNYSLRPSITDGKLNIFADWAAMIKLSICHKFGFNVYYPNECYRGILDYGNIFLLIPFYKPFAKFYFFILPLIINFIFIYSIINLIKPKKLSDYFLLILIFLSPPLLLVLERGNIDILIFLGILITVYFNKPFLSFITILILSLGKYYPLALMVNFFIEKKRRFKNILIILITFLFFFIYFAYILDESFALLVHKYKAFTIPWANEFSIKAISIVSKNHLKNDSIFILSFTYLVFLMLVVFWIFLFKKENSLKEINLKNINQRLFILGANLVTSLFLLTYNVHYREIFIILLFPFLIFLKNKNIKIFTYFIYFTIVRLLFFIISNYLILFEKIILFIYLKAIIDLIYMSFITAMIVLMNIAFLKRIFFKNNFINKN